MNKSILIIDTPIRCEDCELCRDGYLCLRLGEVDESVENGTKDLRCPLKPMPKKIHREVTSLIDYVSSSNQYVCGFNDCIDEILGEAE